MRLWAQWWSRGKHPWSICCAIYHQDRPCVIKKHCSWTSQSGWIQRSTIDHQHSNMYWPEYRTTMNVRWPPFSKPILGRSYSMDPENRTRHLSGIFFQKKKQSYIHVNTLIHRAIINADSRSGEKTLSGYLNNTLTSCLSWSRDRSCDWSIMQHLTGTHLMSVETIVISWVLYKCVYCIFCVCLCAWLCIQLSACGVKRLH